MGLSVIVTAFQSQDTLRACVAQLQRDPSVSQILIADCSPQPPALPTKVRPFPSPTSVPVMRWAMLGEVTEPVVACLEGRCVPAPGWGASILAAHAAHPHTPGIGGAVDAARPARWIDLIVWFCEYAAFAPPLPDAPAADISGAHLSYKTTDLRAEADLLAAGAWETLLHLRWREAGREVRTTGAIIEFRNGMTAGGFLRQRFHYGRGYAAARCRTARRWMLGCLTPALPFLLTLRTATAAGRAGRMLPFLRCLPGIFFFHAMWSAGELLGYWVGASKEQHVY